MKFLAMALSKYALSSCIPTRITLLLNLSGSHAMCAKAMSPHDGSLLCCPFPIVLLTLPRTYLGAVHRWGYITGGTTNRCFDEYLLKQRGVHWMGTVGSGDS